MSEVNSTPGAGGNKGGSWVSEPGSGTLIEKYTNSVDYFATSTDLASVYLDSNKIIKNIGAVFLGSMAPFQVFITETEKEFKRDIPGQTPPRTVTFWVEYYAGKWALRANTSNSYWFHGLASIVVEYEN